MLSKVVASLSVLFILGCEGAESVSRSQYERDLTVNSRNIEAEFEDIRFRLDKLEKKK